MTPLVSQLWPQFMADPDFASCFGRVVVEHAQMLRQERQVIFTLRSSAPLDKGLCARLTASLQPDYEGFMAAALMINFLVPPVLLIINIAAACFRKSTWKFPLGCVAVSLPLLFALIHGFEGGPCAKADVCTSIGGWQLSWGCMEQIGYFMLVFTVFSFVGFALVRLIKHFLRAHR